LGPTWACLPHFSRPALELSQAYQHCRRLAFGHYENFPVASMLLPQPQRDAIAAIYAYARTADDFSDEPAFAKDRVALLRRWRARLDQAPGEDPIFTALADARRRWKLPKQLLADLVQAFLLDCVRTRYASFEQLLGYCRLSANPVGRLVLRVFDLDGPAALKASDDICTALQLANHWQDLASDMRLRGRCYLPGDEMLRFGVTESQLRSGPWTPGLGGLLRLQVDRAESLFASGQDLPALLPGRLGLEIRLTILGGRAILKKIRAQAYDTLSKRPRVGAWDGARLLAAGLMGRTA
jgi:squalene synthase HpnC